MVRRIRRRTPSHWREEVRRIRRIREAVDLEHTVETCLRVSVKAHLDASASILEGLVVALEDDEGPES
jgi:hypothetical protein